MGGKVVGGEYGEDGECNAGGESGNQAVYLYTLPLSFVYEWQ